MVQRLTGIGHQTENLAAAFALLAMSLLPVLEMLLRGLFNLGLPGSIGYVQNLTLWVGFLGAIIASREQRHLNLATAKLVLPAGLKPAIGAATAAISVAVSACLFWASLQFVMSEMADPVRIGGWLPLWCMEAVLPLSFLVITLRFVTQAGRLAHQVVAVSGIPLAALVGLFLAPYAQDLPFGLHGEPPLTLQHPALSIQIRGYIDCVDRAADGSLRVVDYKAGSSRISARELEEGTRLQLPLYALAVRDALSLGPIAGGFYWHIGSASPSYLRLGRYEGGVEGAAEAAIGYVRAYVAAVREGRFPPTPPAGGCPDHCPAVGFCWRYKPRGW